MFKIWWYLIRIYKDKVLILGVYGFFKTFFELFLYKVNKISWNKLLKDYVFFFFVWCILIIIEYLFLIVLISCLLSYREFWIVY